MPSPSSVNAMASDDSAMPYEGRNASFLKPMREKVSVKASSVSGRMGSAPQPATRHLSRVSPSRSIGLDALDAQGVGEVRRVRDGAAHAGERLQPGDRALQEQERRQEVHGHAVEERREHEADEPHVVVERQPRHRDVLVGQPQAVLA